MIRAARCLSSIAIAIGLVALTLAQQSAPSPLTGSEDQTVLQQLTEEFFSAYTRKNSEGLLRMWSAKSPELPAFKQRLQQQFVTWEKVTVKDVTIRQVKVDGARAKLRVELEMSAVDAKTGKPVAGLGKLMRALECVKEDGAWRVWQEVSAYDDMAAAFAALKTEAERTALLVEQKELVSENLIVPLDARGDRLVIQGDYVQALFYYRLAHEVARQIGESEMMASTLGSIAEVHRQQGEFEQALDYFGRSLKLREAAGHKAGMGIVHNNLGTLYRQLGNFELALDHYRQSLRFKRESGSSIAATLGNMGVVYANRGDFTLALEHYQQARQIREEIKDKPGLAITLNNIGTTYINQGNFPLALEHLRKSLALQEEIGNKNDEALALINLGRTLGNMGRYDEAVETHRRSIAVSEEIKNRPRLVSALSGLGGTYIAKGDYEAAGEIFQRSLALAEELRLTPEIIVACKQLSRIYGKQGQAAQALAMAMRSVELAKRVGLRPNIFEGLVSVGMAHRLLQQPAQAQAAFIEAIAVIEAMRSDVVGGASAQQLFFEGKVLPYHELMTLLLDEGQSGAALVQAEQAKARALLDVVTGGGVNITKAMSEPESAREEQLRRQMVSLNAQFTREQQRPQQDQNRLAELKAKIEKARLAYEEFESELYAARPELKVRRGEAPPITAEEAARLLPNAQTALLEYVVTEEKTFIFALTTERKLQVYPLSITAKDLRTRTESFRQQLARRDPEFGAAARELYDLLVKPAAKQLRGKTALVIVPDGPLWDLPFQALQPAAGRYLIERQSISYTPSLTVLREMTRARSKRSNRPPTLLAFGNPTLGQATVSRAKTTLMDETFEPLPDAEDQVRKLAQLYGPRRGKVYIGTEAREERAKAEAAQHRILHLATHGVLNNASPLYSHLLLAQTEGEAKEVSDAKEDGLLEAWELMKLDLNADLVVLSACETARGRVSAGEGVIGLTWALFVAGSPRTVVSQWKVESASTTELMVEFHRQLKTRMRNPKSSLGAAQSLRVAALKMLRGEKYRHPFWWAGFVVVGDGR